MRNVAGVLAAAALGLHCSAPAESTFDTSAPELGAPAETSETSGGAARPQPASPGGAPARDPMSSGSPTETHVPNFTPFLPDSDTTQVTSMITDDAGAIYVTGTFLGRVVIGNTIVTSRGDKDVFLLKIDRHGAFDWVRSVGSASAESSPRVTLDGARVNLMGMTDGAMDCGAGPLPTWSSATFFFCVFGGHDGASIASGVFPTGAP
jgi:hypothetical protein